MRRLVAVLALAALASGCRVKHKAAAKPVEVVEAPVSVVNVADANSATQLTRGFWGIENQSWRWTMKNFNLTLHTPAGAAQKGATLQMHFAVPDVIHDRLGDITVDAHVNGVDLGREKYTKAGQSDYQRDVPASALSGGLVTVDFSVDKGLPPSEKDTRELAIIVTTIGLLPK